MIITVKRNGTIKAVDLKFCKILSVSDHHLWVAISETASEGLLFSRKLSEEEVEQLFEFLLRNKERDVVYDLDDIVEALAPARGDNRAAEANQAV